MQPQKFDETKPYGTVVGHQYAQYEQNGTLYDGAGCPIDMEVLVKSAEDNLFEGDERVSQPSSAAEFFLRNILSGGGVLQSNVKRESESAGLIWMDVQTAAATLGVQKIKHGTASIWKLAE